MLRFCLVNCHVTDLMITFNVLIVCLCIGWWVLLFGLLGLDIPWFTGWFGWVSLMFVPFSDCFVCYWLLVVF